VPPGTVERAIALLAELVARRWTVVREDFDERMLTEVTEDALASVWAQVAAGIGRYERMGEPYVLTAGDHTVVNVPLHCEAGEVLGRVTFNADGSVGGLHLLPV
jgi:flavin-dependent dehydrogenase